MFRKLVTGLGAVVITLALASPAYAAPERYEGDLSPYAQADTAGHVTIKHVRGLDFKVHVTVSGLEPGVYVMHWTNDSSSLTPTKGCTFRVKVDNKTAGCSAKVKAARSDAPLFAAVAKRGDFYNPAGVASFSSDPVFVAM